MQLRQILLFVLVIQSWQNEQTKCVCGHLGNQENCSKSTICQWDGQSCVLKEASYITKITQLDPSNCKIYPQEKCNTLEKCGFHLNMCTEFINCNIFLKDQCSESSYKCVSDGEKCVEVKECKDYLTNIACQNKNIYGKFCVWDISNIPNCIDIEDCSLLPEYFKTDQDCRQALSYCTISKRSYGCQESGQYCEENENENQCITNRDQTIKCYWNSVRQLCKELKCENIAEYTDDGCKNILSKCTTNGITCTDRKRCEDAKSIQGCILDENGNKCAYFQNACTIKGCSTATKDYSNYFLCQGYDDILDCVSVKGGGCKNKPTQCIGFEQELDCNQQESLRCIWYKGKCLVKQCSYAPQTYTQNECKKFGNCIGQVGGGCQDWPETCDLILQSQFCEFDKNGNWCRWSNSKCLQLICSNFKYPQYQTHAQCQLLSKKCTYSTQFASCIDFLCETISDDIPCLKDYNGNKCIKRFGCMEKKCSKAPIQYNTNSLCEDWMPSCTVNIIVISSSKLIKGCIVKKGSCLEYTIEQCYTTSNGQKCKWSSNKCILKQCSDAEITYTTNEDCLKYQLNGPVPCILKVNGAGCQDWPLLCSNLGSMTQCNYGLYDGTKCYWNGSSCKDRICNNAINSINTNILCNEFNPSCILDSDSLGCKVRPANLLCSDAPNSSLYDSHDKCFAWNKKCTVKPIVGCIQKSSMCSEYKSNQCFYNKIGVKCKWTSGGCIDLNCAQRVDTISLNNSNCEAYDINCTVQRPNTCISLKGSCNQYLEEQSCVINSYYEYCRWDLSTNTCYEVTCEDYTSATSEWQCFGWKQGFRCQIKINSNGTFGPGCETRKTSCYGLIQTICNKTVLYNGSRCYYYNSNCQVLGSENCNEIETNGYQQHHICLYYASNCIGDLANTYGKCQHKNYCLSYHSTLCTYMGDNYNECMLDPVNGYCRSRYICGIMHLGIFSASLFMEQWWWMLYYGLYYNIYNHRLILSWLIIYLQIIQHILQLCTKLFRGIYSNIYRLSKDQDILQ